MSLTFELAEFTVDPENEQALLEGRRTMAAALRRAFPGALGMWLTRQDDGSWLDIVLWRSRAEAEDAAARINELPEARAWFGHIAESRGLRHTKVVDQQLFDLMP
jgi:Antibiotic biosynthesis monooxygenase